jgi:hypothetical protein
VNLLLNDPAAAKIKVCNRACLPTRDARGRGRRPQLTDKDVIAFLKELTAELSPTSPAIQPVGASDSQNTITR